MSAPQSLTIPLAAELAARLAAAVERTGLTATEIAARALTDHLDGVTAYSRLGREMSLMKDQLAELAGLIGEALAEPSPGAVIEICRFRAPKAPVA